MNIREYPILDDIAKELVNKLDRSYQLILALYGHKEAFYRQYMLKEINKDKLDRVLKPLDSAIYEEQQKIEKIKDNFIFS